MWSREKTRELPIAESCEGLLVCTSTTFLEQWGRTRQIYAMTDSLADPRESVRIRPRPISFNFMQLLAHILPNNGNSRYFCYSCSCFFSDMAGERVQIAVREVLHTFSICSQKKTSTKINYILITKSSSKGIFMQHHRR